LYASTSSTKMARSHLHRPTLRLPPHAIALPVPPARTALQVERPEQCHFDRDQLLVSMVYFTVRLAEQPVFVQAVSAVSVLRCAVVPSAALCCAPQTGWCGAGGR